MSAFRRFPLALALGLSVACAGTPAPTGSVSGIAVDETGHGLPGITVTIQTPAGKIVDTSLTAADGSYIFPTVPVGQYQVVTLLQGFTTPSPLSATVLAGQSTPLPPLRLVPPGFLQEGSPSITLETVTPTPTPKS